MLATAAFVCRRSLVRYDYLAALSATLGSRPRVKLRCLGRAFPTFPPGSNAVAFYSAGRPKGVLLRLCNDTGVQDGSCFGGAETGIRKQVIVKVRSVQSGLNGTCILSRAAKGRERSACYHQTKRLRRPPLEDQGIRKI